MTETEPHWWDVAAAAFDAWLATQSDEVQEMGLLEQIDLYAADTTDGARPMTEIGPTPKTAEPWCDTLDQFRRLDEQFITINSNAARFHAAQAARHLQRGREAEAQLAVLQAERAWRPIETARAAGHRRFLCWDSYYGIRIGTVHVRVDHDDWLSYMDGFGGSSKGGMRATHWQPLPALPSEETETNG